MAASMTGTAIGSQKELYTTNVLKDPAVYQRQSFLREAGVHSMASSPVNFVDGTRGALNIYRQTSSRFTTIDLANLRQFAALLPQITQVIWNRLSLDLLNRMSDLLGSISEGSPTAQHDKAVFEGVARLLSDSFRCLEVSIFVEQDLNRLNVYQPIATTWPWPERFPQDPYVRTAIRDKATTSLTEHVVGTGSPLAIFDLRDFRTDRDRMHRRFPTIEWDDSLRVEESVREHLGLDSGAEVPPISWIAAPIYLGDKLLGLIRCCAPRSAAYYFAGRELALLSTIGTQLGHWWSNRLERVASDAENSSWKRLVRSVSLTNDLAYHEVEKVPPSMERICEEALRIAADVIPGADILNVRLANKESTSLAFFRGFGKDWDTAVRSGSPVLSKIFPLDGDEPLSGGAWVMRNQTVSVMQDVSQATHYSETFAGTKSMIIAPISTQGEAFGVLDVRSTGNHPFPYYAERIAELLGRQLGLYFHMSNTVGQLQGLQRQITEEGLRQAEMYRILAHQVRSPLIGARTRSERFVKQMQSVALPQSKAERHLLALRGLVKKAYTVAMNTRMFAMLAQGEGVEVEITNIDPGDLVKELIEAAVDNELTIEDYRGIRFDVNRRSIEVVRTWRFDMNLVRQAIAALLDNAGKYSYPNTVVQIYGGLTGGNRPHITVSSTGHSLSQHEAAHCTDLYWRGDRAKRVTGEGDGIGLWIVRNIMTGHGGDLQVIATDRQGVTQFKLVFPRDSKRLGTADG
jgi:signal transduction histidine kinase